MEAGVRSLSSQPPGGMSQPHHLFVAVASTSMGVARIPGACTLTFTGLEVTGYHSESLNNI